MKNLIYKFLDRHYPIKNGLIDISFHYPYQIINMVFAINDITFDDWRLSRIGEQYGILYSNGNKEWYQNGEKHRDNDLPAVINSNGTKFWYKNGLTHRDNDKPAVITSSGSKCWYKNGERYRDNNLPAIIHANGTKQWCKNDKQYYPDN